MLLYSRSIGNFFINFVTKRKFNESNTIYKNIRLCSSNQPENEGLNMKKDLVLVERIGGIQLIGINRPEKRNCINSATADALLQAFKEFDDDDKAKVAVLYGVGGNFCSGYDLDEIADGSTMDISKFKQLDRGPMGPTRYETSKPVIGAIEGYAVAGGLELALWCDTRIMDETAVMGVFCRRFGVPLIDGGTVRLPAIVGLGRAMDLILTGRPVRAPEALQIGLVSEVCACGSAVGNAVHRAQPLEHYPAEALRADRESARNSFFASSFKEALKREFERGVRPEVYKEAYAGASKFLNGQGKHGAFQSLPSSSVEEYFKSEDR